MSSTDRPTVRVHTTEDMLALIPFLLGFQPDTSLVLLAVDERSGGIAMAARLDLPTAEQPLGQVHAALDLVIAKLATGGGISVVLAGYGPADRVEPMVTAASDALQAAGIPIRDALRVADGRFWRLRCADPMTDPVACPPDGVAFEPATSPAAAAAVYAGLVALPDREALAATLAPVTGPARDGMVAATTAACAFLTELLDAARTDSDDPGDQPDAVLDTRIGRALQAAARTYLTQIQDPLPGRAAARRRTRRDADRPAGPALAVGVRRPAHHRRGVADRHVERPGPPHRTAVHRPSSHGAGPVCAAGRARSAGQHGGRPGVGRRPAGPVRAAAPTGDRRRHRPGHRHRAADRLNQPARAPGAAPSTPLAVWPRRGPPATTPANRHARTDPHERADTTMTIPSAAPASATDPARARNPQRHASTTPDGPDRRNASTAGEVRADG
jgi:hypothetical protein